MKVIIYNNRGTCALVFPAYKDIAAYHADELAYIVDTYSNGDNLVKHQITKPFSNDEILQRAIDKSVPADVEYKVIEFDEIKAAIIDRTFRDAWCFCKKQGVRVDMEKARDIHRNRLRSQRAPLLESLDIQFMRASEQSGEAAEKAKKAVLAKKKFLRDLPADPAIDKAKTPEALKAFDPLAGFSVED